MILLHPPITSTFSILLPQTRLVFGTRGSFHIKSWSRLWCLWHLGGAVAQNHSHGDVQVSWQSIGDVLVNMEIWGFTRQNISDISWIEWMIIMNTNDKCKKLQSWKIVDGDWSIFSMWRVWESYSLGLSLVENWNWNKLGSQSASKTWSSETLEEVFGEHAVCIVLEFTLYIWMQFELMNSWCNGNFTDSMEKLTLSMHPQGHQTTDAKSTSI